MIKKLVNLSDIYRNSRMKWYL